VDDSKRKHIDRILKLFALGGEDANTTEAETLAAVTKAREMMARHQISMAEIELAKGAATAQAIQVKIDQYHAYTRKGGTLAQYDLTVAEAVGILCDCRFFLRTTVSRNYRTDKTDKHISVVFMGEEQDVALASELFMIWLQAVRKAARQKYGSGKNLWTPQHTAYAVGFGVRMIQRAKDQVRTLTAEQQKTWALVLRSKAQALNAAWDKLNIRNEKNRRKELDVQAYSEGYVDGGKFNMSTKLMKPDKSEDLYLTTARTDEEFHAYMDQMDRALGYAVPWRTRLSEQEQRDAAKKWQHAKNYGAKGALKHG
jgi:hypothetical protein